MLMAGSSTPLSMESCELAHLEVVCAAGIVEACFVSHGRPNPCDIHVYLGYRAKCVHY